uniref:Uncharacterized protein n=1 Tax=Tanacetum cinerariifolium TaxID=118510 RepID=A0A6L2JHR1_TANCI|nr:hypothetical protein [Tanacetum cinerariifolium]
MTTHNVGRRTAATRGRGTSEQDGQDGERLGDQAGSGRGGQRSSQGDGRDGQEVVVESLTLLPSSLSSCKTYYPLL